MTITISFQYHIQDSVSVGDVAYYVTVGTDGGFDINSSSVVEIGEITAVDRANKTITCDTALFGNQTPRENVFILFSKNNCQEGASLLGYFGSFRFKNNSTDKAELFAVTVDAFESSK